MNRKTVRPTSGSIFSIAICIFLVISVVVFPVRSINAFAHSSVNSTQVGIVLPTDAYRWTQDSAIIQATLTAAGYTSQALYSQDSSDTEKSNVEALISQGIQVLIFCPVDSIAAAAAAAEAWAAGIKVISYDRLIMDTEAVNYYVTFDSISVGELQGQYLIDHANGTGNPLFLYAGAAFDNNSFQFFEGAWNVLQPKFEDGTFVIKNSSEAVSLQSNHTLTHDQQASIISQITTQWDPNTAAALAQANLDALTPADKGHVFILGPNDSTAMAIADVFAADADIHGYVITGQDAYQPAVQYIIDGRQTMTVFKDIRTLAKDGAKVAITFIQGGTPDASMTYNNGKIDVPSTPSAVIAVDKDNLKIALIDSGFYQLSDFTWPVISVVITNEGGTLTSPFDSTTYTFSTGTFTDTVLVTHSVVFITTDIPNLEGIGHSFDLTAVYSSTGQIAQPTQPFTVTVQYTDEQRGAVIESTLAFYSWDGAQWVKEPSSVVDVVSNTITATPGHFSTWNVMGEAPRVYMPLLRR